MGLKRASACGLADAPAFAFESIDSTNDEALRRLRAGEAAPFWVIAREQTRGRGRENRAWVSPPGNLYASLAICPLAHPRDLAGLSLVAGLAAHDAMHPLLAPSQRPDLRLKWPNDLMLGQEKLGGILLESLQTSPGGRSAVVIGIGINLAAAPELSDRRAATARLEVSDAARAEAFRRLAAALDTRLAEWDEGRGFPRIRSAWLERAHALGETISVRVHGNVISGTFRGIDETGALELATPSGQIRRVLAGEVCAAA